MYSFILLYIIFDSKLDFTWSSERILNFLIFFGRQISYQVLRLRLSAGGLERPVHRAVVPQQSQRSPGKGAVEEAEPRAAGEPPHGGAQGN